MAEKKEGLVRRPKDSTVVVEHRGSVLPGKDELQMGKGTEDNRGIEDTTVDKSVEPAVWYAQILTLQRALDMLLTAHRAAVELIVKSRGQNPTGLLPFEDMAPVKIARDALSTGPVKLNQRLQLLETLCAKATNRKSAKSHYIEELESAFKGIKEGLPLQKGATDAAYEIVKHCTEEEDAILETLRQLDAEPKSLLES